MARPSSKSSARDGGRAPRTAAVIRSPDSLPPKSHISEEGGRVSTAYHRRLELLCCLGEVVAQLADIGHGAAIGRETEVEAIHVALHRNVEGRAVRGDRYRMQGRHLGAGAVERHGRARHV